MGKYCTVGQATDDNRARAFRMPDNYGKNTNPRSDYVILLLFYGKNRHKKAP